MLLNFTSIFLMCVSSLVQQHQTLISEEPLASYNYQLKYLLYFEQEITIVTKHLRKTQEERLILAHDSRTIDAWLSGSLALRSVAGRSIMVEVLAWWRRASHTEASRKQTKDREKALGQNIVFKDIFSMAYSLKVFLSLSSLVWNTELSWSNHIKSPSTCNQTFI